MFENWEHRWVLVWKLGVSWVLVWKLGVSWVLQIQQTEAHITGLRVSSMEFLFTNILIFLFLKIHQFLNVFSYHIPVHYRIWYFMEFPRLLRPPIPKSGVVTPNPQNWSLYKWGFISRYNKPLRHISFWPKYIVYCDPDWSHWHVVCTWPVSVHWLLAQLRGISWTRPSAPAHTTSRIGL